MSDQEQSVQNYWVWVTGPDYYFDEDGYDREELDPDSDEAWFTWTCHKDTQPGDLVFLYRTTPKKDLGYLIQAESSAYSNGDEEEMKKGWDYMCECKFLYKFADPVTINDLREDPGLDDWGPMRANFRRKVFKVSPDDWHKLTRLAARHNPDFEEFIGYVEQQEVARVVLREEQLEDALANNLDRLAPFGYDLELYNDPDTAKTGRQLVCQGEGGRIDLLCYDRKNDQYVVIELKNVRAECPVFAQISRYIGWVKKRIADNQPVIGIVISRGTDPKFESARSITDCVRQIDLSKLGFE